MDPAYEELADAVAARLSGAAPHLVGITGAVAVGKTTVADGLASRFAERGRRVHVVATDAFLYPNAVLDARGITFRKGFPESFDLDALAAFLQHVKAGRARIEVPVYSHAIYDIVPGEVAVIEQPDLLIVEGVIALQPPVVEALHVGVYVDAEEKDVRAWFVERFLKLTDEARDDPASFYARFVEMPADRLRALAEGTWDAINGVNLREHILPSRTRAMFTIEKAADHSVRRLRRPLNGFRPEG